MHISRKLDCKRDSRDVNWVPQRDARAARSDLTSHTILALFKHYYFYVFSVPRRNLRCKLAFGGRVGPCTSTWMCVVIVIPSCVELLMA